MEDLGKKVGYLKGLMEGMDFSNDPSKGKLIDAMADLLSDLAERVENIEELMDDLNDYVESIDDDLAELEGSGKLPMGEDDEDYDYELFDDPVEVEDQIHVLGGKSDEAEEETETLAGSICPECKRMFFVGVDDPEDAQYDCPHCGKRVTPEPLTPDNAPIARPAE